MKQLTLIDKAFLLKRTYPFAGLDLDLLLGVADKLSLVTYDPGDFVFVMNEEANRMYFILKGQVEIRLNPPSPICTLSSNDFFGEESLFNNRPRGYEAFCPIETSLLTLSRTNLFAIISECPSVAVALLELYTVGVKFRPIEAPL
jgi:CRP/FNR family transcriptional regulator, cyclic AMP receptor protein